MAYRINLGKISMVHQRGRSIGVLSWRGLSDLVAARGGVGYLEYVICDIDDIPTVISLVLKTKIRPENSGHGEDRTSCVSRTTTSGSESRSLRVGRLCPPRALSSPIVDLASKRKVSPPLLPKLRSCGTTAPTPISFLRFVIHRPLVCIT